MDLPPHMQPFVVPVEPRTAERAGRVDLYRPAGVTEPVPAIVFVPGGPVPAELEPTPRGWPVFQGYVPSGQHGFDSLDHADESIQAVTRAVDSVLGFLA